MARSRAWVESAAGLQWFSFMFTNTVVIPISTGAAFGLSTQAVSGVMARAFLLTGIACLLQGWFGHRLPLMEGQSGLWWSVILGIAGSTAARPGELSTVGGNLTLGMAIGGVLVIGLGAIGLHRLLQRLFTPVVMAVLLFLLAAQLIDIFFRGMLGVAPHGHVHAGIAGISLLTAATVGALTLYGRGLGSNFSILIGLAGGWMLFTLCFGPSWAGSPVPSMRVMAQGFVFGRPPGLGGHLEIGIILTALFTALINTTNTIATLRAAEPMFSVDVPDSAYRRSLAWSGLLTAISGWLGQVPYAPYTSSIGFLRTTRLLQRTPFFIGAGLFAVCGLIPALSGFFATLPFSVGASVLFIAYLQLFGAAFQNLEGMAFNFRTIYRIAVPVLIGLALQSMPAAAFDSVPGLVRPIVSNGMLMGIFIAVILEGAIAWGKWETL